MATIHVFDYLAKPADYPPPPVCVVFGDAAFFKPLVLRQLQQAISGEDETPFHTFDGQQTQWRDVADEVATLSLFGGGGRRIALVESADSFVSAYRDKLEDYAASPSTAGVMILVVDQWASNTRLYKSIDKTGLQIACRAPTSSARSKKPDLKRVAAWITRWAKSEHGFMIDSKGANLLLDLVDVQFGLLNQALAKLALFAGVGGTADAEMVRDVVGGWKTKSAWDMLDAAADGNASEALLQLDRLIQAGESPFAVFGQIAFTLRKYASATRLFRQAEQSRRPITVATALKAAGFREWPTGEIGRVEKRLKQLGRDRAGQFSRWILEADLALKGSHSPDDRARWVLERLILRMAKRAG